MRLLNPLLLTIAVGVFISCHKISEDPHPLPVWENTKADSATLRILITTLNGTPIPGQHVNLYLSFDSLTNGSPVRIAETNAIGVSEFRRLYPRTYYYNCYARYNETNLYGTGNLKLAPYANKDTFMIVY